MGLLAALSPNLQRMRQEGGGEVVDLMQRAVGPYPSLKVCDGDQLEGEVVRKQV
jgi:hypothetical protein